jgi:hypothetical protein
MFAEKGMVFIPTASPDRNKALHGAKNGASNGVR